MNKNLADILLSLRPGAKFVTRNNIEIEWHDSEQTQPTQDEIDAERARLQAEYDSKAWSRARQSAYPSWQEQMDMMYHDQTEGSRTWLDAIEAVKEAHPK